ncbi:PEP-CTERM sorting domain-containing protein [bacterium]|nr:MAG: PEP-CTERM sorting domain-containing protein [bacterium]
MRKTLALLAPVAALLASPAAAATAISYTPGSNILGNNQIIFQSFDVLGPTGLHSAVYSSGVTNQAAQPIGSTGGFLAVGNTATGFPSNFGYYSLNLPVAAPVVSFLLGTLDSYNTVILNYANGSSDSYTGNQIIGGGVFTQDGRVTYDVSSANSLNFISNISFISSQAAMEIDDVASAAPEPGAWLMMILGFGLIGSALRNRNKLETGLALS